MLSTSSKPGSFFAAVPSRCLSVAVAIAVVSGVAIAAESPYASLPSAERIAADIAAVGESAVLRDRLWPDADVFDSLLDRIETGAPDWLRIAAALRSVSDAGASESLTAAVTVALAKQPDNVLRLLAPATGDRAFTAADVCSARFAFIEQPDAQKRWRVEALQALGSEREPSLSKARDACLAAMPPAQ